MSRRRWMRACALGAALGFGAVAAPAAHADFSISSLSAGLTDPATAANELVAGAHPDLFVGLSIAQTSDTTRNDDLRRLRLDLPDGLVVSPAAAPTCTQPQLYSFDDPCPDESQVGTVSFDVNGTPNDTALYNMATPESSPAQFAFNYLGVIVKFNGRVRPDGRYTLGADLEGLTQALHITAARVTLWGVPADPVHDDLRDPYASPGGDATPSSAPRNAFVSSPTTCSGEPLTFSVAASSWQDPRVVTATDRTAPDGTPLTLTGCESLPFEPTASVAPTTTAPDSPSGLRVRVDVPQTRSPSVLATSHLRDLRLTLPAGMAINPSVATGLSACSSAEIALGSDAAATCPASSKLGSVGIDTPLLDDPLTGDVFLAKQGDNPFGTLLGLYLVAQGSNVTLKLPGRIDLDPASGRLVATFAQNPQLPFSRLDVTLDGGDRAPLVTPAACGPQSVTTELTPWSGAATRTVTSGFSIDCVAGLGGFAPGFAAGTVSTSAGASTPLVLDVTRPDGQAQLNGLSLSLPTGLLAKLRGVPRCADAQADAGTCDAASRVGGATIAAGAGSQPFALPGDVFLTGPYKGAPFGLAVRVRALAGPLDLGTVIVRQALSIDPDDTHVTVVSDPLPTILEGIPIRLRTLHVQVDRPDFVVNPTSCAAKTIGATLGAVDGRTAAQSVAFRVGGCEGLRLSPKLALSLRGRRSGLRDGGHPALRAVLSQPSGQSNLRTARVTLPLSLALDPDNARALCETADGAKAEPTCPKGSVVGYARARTPLLDRELGGFVYFVKGQRTTKTGKVVKTLPTLVVPLTGDGVRITLRAKTAVSKNRLVTTFERIPDAPVSRFDLSLSGGKHGILVTNGNACKRSRKLAVSITGQSRRTTRSGPRLGARCTTPKRKGSR